MRKVMICDDDISLLKHKFGANPYGMMANEEKKTTDSHKLAQWKSERM